LLPSLFAPFLALLPPVKFLGIFDFLQFRCWLSIFAVTA
jgi:hypothetical protein